MTVKKFLKSFKNSEQTISTFLGIFVVIIVGLLVFNRLQIKLNNPAKENFDISTQQKETLSNKTLPTTHKVKRGEKLWDIAVLYYNSGYNWVDISKANKLSNPNIIFSDQELIIPNVAPQKLVEAKTSVISPNKEISSSKYTISKGDNLWTIAVRAYGDGYKWVEIAKANGLVNPGIIHSGNVLILPR